MAAWLFTAEGPGPSRISTLLIVADCSTAAFCWGLLTSTDFATLPPISMLATWARPEAWDLADSLLIVSCSFLRHAGSFATRQTGGQSSAGALGRRASTGKKQHPESVLHKCSRPHRV
jgi:hypothetical protein